MRLRYSHPFGDILVIERIGRCEYPICAFKLDGPPQNRFVSRHYMGTFFDEVVAYLRIALPHSVIHALDSDTPIVVDLNEEEHMLLMLDA